MVDSWHEAHGEASPVQVCAGPRANGDAAVLCDVTLKSRATGGCRSFGVCGC